MTHKGIAGKDYTQASGLFLSMLTATAIRGIISRYNGFDGPRMPLEHQTPRWAQAYIDQNKKLM